MKKVMALETLVLVAVAIPAFAAVTCTEKVCIETKNVQTNTTLDYDAITSKIMDINRQLQEIPEEIARDKARYVDEKNLKLDALKAEKDSLKALLNKMKNNGATITQEDIDLAMERTYVPANETQTASPVEAVEK